MATTATPTAGVVVALAGAHNLHLEPGRSRRRLMADIRTASTSPTYRSGVNGVTGDYSRGAAGSGSRTASSPIRSAR